MGIIPWAIVINDIFNAYHFSQYSTLLLINKQFNFATNFKYFVWIQFNYFMSISGYSFYIIYSFFSAHYEQWLSCL